LRLAITAVTEKGTGAQSLEVHIERAKNLVAMDVGGSSDPYVKLWLDSSVKVSTRACNRMLAPL